MERYNAKSTEKKWQEKWEKEKTYFTDVDVNKEKYKAVSNSFGVRNAVDQADKKMKQWKVTGVPSLIVNGKYKVAASRAVRTDQLFEVVDFLVEKERN